MSSSNCCFAGKVVWYFDLLKNFQEFVVIYTVKGFGIINKAAVDVSRRCTSAGSCDGTQAQPRKATPCSRSGEVAERSYLASEVRGGVRGCQAATAQEQQRSYPTQEVRSCGREEQPHVQGAVVARVQESLEELATPRSRSGRAAVRRYPSSKVRETQVRQ